MNFEFAPFFCQLFKFRPAIYSKTMNFILSSESFITNETFFKSSSSMLDKLKKEGDSTANAAIYIVILV